MAARPLSFSLKTFCGSGVLEDEEVMELPVVFQILTNVTIG
ncbi:hypothetical protein SynBIOSE41_01052 [Synechococcus sp. BIOS-E4-1]|nr:hypothetical protein SynBIOSE41_01052 [Synechococcus sp. BIOS-E4-1]